jgi:hypothetical protein
MGAQMKDFLAFIGAAVLLAAFAALCIGQGGKAAILILGKQAIERGYAEDCGDSWEWAGECEPKVGK